MPNLIASGKISNKPQENVWKNGENFEYFESVKNV